MGVSAQINPEESWKCLNQLFRPLISAILVAACSNSPSLSHILYSSCCYITAIKRYHRCPKRNILLVRSSICCLRLPGASSKIQPPLHEGCRTALSDQLLFSSTTKTAASRAQGVPPKACCRQESWSCFGPRTRARTR